MRSLIHLVVILCVSVFILASACTSPSSQEDSSGDQQETAAVQPGAYDLNVDDRVIHYEVYGNGPVCIVLTNSWGLNIGGVRGVFKVMEDFLTMVYFDPRGMGQSSEIEDADDMSMAAVREDAKAVFDHLGLDSAIFAGWSNGASNLLVFAAEHPEIVSHAIAMHGSAYVDLQAWMAEMQQAYPDLLQKFMDFQAAVSNPELSEDEKMTLMNELYNETYMPALFADEQFGREAVKEVFAEAEWSLEHSNAANQDLATFDARPVLKDITSSLLVIAGEHDMVSPDVIKEIYEGAPNATFVIFTESGHFAPVEEQELFIATVKAFLGIDE